MAELSSTAGHVQVTQEDLHRVAAATGAAVQTTVNNLNTKCLGTCKAFEERQVRNCLVLCPSLSGSCQCSLR